MLQELLYLGPKQRLRRLLTTICVQNLHRATPATFRTQIEQGLLKMCEIKQPIRKRHWKSEIFQDPNWAIWTHLEQPKFRFKTKWKIWTLFEPKYKNFKCLLKIEGSPENFLNIKRLMPITSPLKQYHFHTILFWWHSPFKSIENLDYTVIIWNF